MVFALIKGITNLEAKGVYVGSLIKKRCYWLKEVPGDLIDTHFKDKEVRDDGMLDSIIQYNKLLIIFLIQYLVFKKMM